MTQLKQSPFPRVCRMCIWGKKPWRTAPHASLRSLKLFAEVLSDTVGGLCLLCHWKWTEKGPKKKRYTSKFRSIWCETFPSLPLATSANATRFASYAGPTLVTWLLFNIWHLPPASLASTLQTVVLHHFIPSVHDGSSTHSVTHWLSQSDIFDIFIMLSSVLFFSTPSFFLSYILHFYFSICYAVRFQFKTN